jgi:adenosylhomocysteine nucleosidase
MTRVAIIAAMTGELKPLVRGWNHECRNGVDLWRFRHDGGELVAACSGAGLGAATRAFAEVEKDGPINRVISTGWAGALSDECIPGRAYSVSGVIDVRTGERFEAEVVQNSVDCSSASQNQTLVCPVLWLATSPKVADATEKQRLAAVYSAGLVDMEAAAVAYLAAMRGIPFECIKGVSDGLADNLPDFNNFISLQGEFQLARFIFFVLPRPWHWFALMRMGENSNKAAHAIRESLLERLGISGAIKRENGYSKSKC